MPNNVTVVMIGQAIFDEEAGTELWDADAFMEETAFECKKPGVNLCEWVRPIPETLVTDAEYLEWARENWGTKWGTYDLKIYPETRGDGTLAIISFICANAPPNAVVMELIKEKFRRSWGLSIASVIVHDPYDNSIQAR